MKITIVGNAGSGKSYLSLKLAEILNLRVYHLDKYYWKPGWAKVQPEEFNSALLMLCKESDWIIEGSYVRYLEPRFEAADIIIFLDLPIYSCMKGVFRRLFYNWGKVSKTVADNCPEKLRLSFIKWVWDFNKKHRKSIYDLIEKYSSKKIYILYSKKEINEFIKSFKID